MNIIRINYAFMDGRFKIAVKLIEGSIAERTYPFHLNFVSVEDILCFKEEGCFRSHDHYITKYFEDESSMLIWKDILVFTLRKKQREWEEQHPLENLKEERVAFLPSSEDFIIS